MAYHLHLIFAILAIALTALRSNADDCDEMRKCYVENIRAQKYFDMNQFLGKWYKIKWYPTPKARYQKGSSQLFNVIDYKKDDTATAALSDYLQIAGTARWMSRPDGIHGLCMSGDYSFLMAKNTTGEIWHTDVPEFFGMYLVVLTDYKSYALVWQCDVVLDYGPWACPKNWTQSWVLSRSNTLGPEQKNLIEKKIVDLCLDPSAFQNVDPREECPYDQ